MIITILHGDNTVYSREERNNILVASKKAGKEVIVLDSNDVDQTLLIQSLESQSLFSDQRLVIVDNLISSLRKGKKRDAIINYLVSGKFDANLVLWERKGVGRSIIKLKRIKHVTVKEFKTPVVVFSFVDSLKPNNAAISLSNFQKTLDSSVPEVVFSMMVRQFRLLLGLSVEASIPEVTRLAPWQLGKLKQQARQFSLSDLKLNYRALMLIDYQVKTGRSPYDLTKRIEQFIISL